MNVYPSEEIQDLPDDEDHAGRKLLQIPFADTCGPVTAPFLHPNGKVCQVFMLSRSDGYHQPHAIPCESWPGETEPTEDDILPELYNGLNNYRKVYENGWQYDALPSYSSFALPAGWNTLVLLGQPSFYEDWLTLQYQTPSGMWSSSYDTGQYRPEYALTIEILGWEGANNVLPNAFGSGTVRQTSTALSYETLLPGYYAKICDWIYCDCQYVLAITNRRLSSGVTNIAALVMLLALSMMSAGPGSPARQPHTR